MSMTKTISGALALAGVFALVACGKGADSQHGGMDHNGMQHGSMQHGNMHGSMQTKVIKHEGLQVTFDLMGGEQHRAMMKQMKMEMHHDSKSEHFLGITVYDQAAKKVLTNAAISVSIATPSGKKLRPKARMMKGAGMAHYMVEFPHAGKGTYTISVEASVKGKKHAHSVKFEL